MERFFPFFPSFLCRGNEEKEGRFVLSLFPFPFFKSARSPLPPPFTKGESKMVSASWRAKLLNVLVSSPPSPRGLIFFFFFFTPTRKKRGKGRSLIFFFFFFR